MSEMRLCGYESATYLDDVYLQANTRVDCQNNVRETAECLMSLGFVIHPVKSDPATSICHIGFLLNLTTMEIYLPPDKAKAVTMFCNKIAASINPKIREVARCKGLQVSCFPAVGLPHGKLYYRQIEMDKIKALTQARGNFEKTMTLSAGAGGGPRVVVSCLSRQSSGFGSRSRRFERNTNVSSPSTCVSQYCGEPP